MKVEFEGHNFEMPDGLSSEEMLDLAQKAKPAGYKEAIQAIPGVAKGLLQSAVGGTIQGIAEQKMDPFRRQLWGSIGVDPEKLEEWRSSVSAPVSKAGAGIAKIGEETAEEATPANLSFWQRAVMSGGANALVQIPALALSVAAKSPAPSLTAAGVLEGGSSYAEKREAGLSVERAAGHAAVDIAAEVALEMLPLKFILDNVGGPVLRLIAGTIIREVPTEVATSAIQQANAMLSDKPDMTWEEYGQGLLDTAGATLISAPLLGASAKLMSSLDRTPGETPDSPRQKPQPTPPPEPEFDIPTMPPAPDQAASVQALIDQLNQDLIPQEQLDLAKEEARKFDAAKAVPKLEAAAVAWMDLETAPTNKMDAGELGASAKQTANAPNYINPNNQPRLERAFSFGPEEAIGKTPQQILPQTNTYVLGEPTPDRPAELLSAMRDTVEQWRQKFLPGATIVLSNEQLFTDSALGWHYSTRPGFHMIVPAVLRNAKEGLGAFNRNTQASIFYNTTHEFGHALVSDRLLEGVDPLIAQGIWKEAESGLISSRSLAAVTNPKAQAVLQTFNEMKARILDNSMTAQEFVEQWLGPAKMGRQTFLKDLGVAPTDRAMAVAEALARRAVKRSRVKDEIGRKELREQLTREYFGIEEFLAEQLSRHAYESKWEAKTPLGKMFKDALKSLRDALQGFFKHLKATGGIKATTTFQEWLDDLARGDRALTEPAKRTRAAKNGPKIETKAKAAPKKEVKKKLPRVQHNVEAESDQVKVQTAKMLVADLLRAKIIEPGSPQMKELLAFARNKEWSEFTEAYNAYGIKRVKFELDDVPEAHRPVLEKMSVVYGNLGEHDALDAKTTADAIAEWKKNGLKSKYVKAYFGDWENAPAGVRTPGVSAVRTFSGEPLILFHFTRTGVSMGKSRVAFTQFARGDIGFHFGTQRAANIRGTRGALQPSTELAYVLAKYEEQGIAHAEVTKQLQLAKQDWAEDAYIIPVILNIRNPLQIAAEDLQMWNMPADMGQALIKRSVITPEEYDQAMLQANMLIEQLSDVPVEERITEQYGAFEPFRQLLMRKGYDGMAYHNLVEGDLSYVAFYPNQVKSLLGHSTFSRSEHIHLELDFDKSSPEGEGASRMYRGLRNFHPDPVGWRKALRGVQNLAYHTLQIQQLAHLNQDLDQLISFNVFNTEYNLRKNLLQAPADAITQVWETLGKENIARVNKVLLDEMESGQTWFEPDNPTLNRDGTPRYWTQWKMNEKAAQELHKRGIDISTEQGAELAKLILDVKNHLLYRLNELQRVLVELLANRYGANQLALQGKADDLNSHIIELRRTPFFPQGRFGKHMLTIERAKDGGGWEVVYREAFESETKRDEARIIADARKDTNERVRGHDLNEGQYVLMTLPQDFLDLVATELDLNTEQLARLTELAQPIKKEKALKTYDIARLGVKGYSSDALRSFANFAWHDSNMLAKLEYRWRFNLAIRGMRSQLRESQYQSPPNPQETWRLEQVTRAMERATDYLMAPGHELQSLRAFVSVMYLGLNIKTAAINLYGLVTTYSDLISRAGVVDGHVIMAKATAKAFRSIKLLNFNERNKGDYLNPDERWALDKALEEGVLSQSYAYHLAGLANQGTLNRLVPGYNLSSRITKRGIDLSMWAFRLTELSARRATFLAQYELAKREHGAGNEAYSEAVRRTNLLQNDYSHGNRVPFMRGGFMSLGPVAPLATVFLSFAQHMAFHGYGGYELGERRAARLKGETPRTIMFGYTMNIWLITLLVAGYEGLPGMENVLDLLEAAWRKFGGKKPIRQALREYVQAVDVGIDPQSAAHGLGHNIGGFDVSRSIGFGRFIPGTDIAARAQQGSVDEFAGTLTLDMLGASGSLIRFGMGAYLDPRPKSEYLTRMPGGFGSIYTALYWKENGVHTPMGTRIIRDLETGQLRDLTDVELWGKALGFNPTVISQNRAMRWDYYDQKMYWQSRRKRLLDDVWRARWQEDREAEADARKAVTDFNASVPNDISSLRVRPIDISRSIQTRTRRLRQEEAEIAPERRFRELYRDVRDSYDGSASGDTP